MVGPEMTVSATLGKPFENLSHPLVAIDNHHTLGIHVFLPVESEPF